jgi:hypothetical protein
LSNHPSLSAPGDGPVEARMSERPAPARLVDREPSLVEQELAAAVLHLFELSLTPVGDSDLTPMGSILAHSSNGPRAHEDGLHAPTAHLKRA